MSTKNERRENVLMVLPCHPKRVYEVSWRSDAAVGREHAGRYAVAIPPEVAICRE